MDKKKLQGLVKELDRCKEELVEPNEAMKDALKAAKEDQGLHVQAFKVVWRLARMPPDKRADFLRGFDEYRMQLGIDVEQADMLENAA